MKTFILRALAVGLPVALWAAPAAAYVGPGAGITLVGALWGVVIAIAAAVGFILLWPLRRAFHARNHRSDSDAARRQADDTPSAKAGRS